MTWPDDPIAWGWESVKMLVIKDINSSPGGVVVDFEMNELLVF